MPESVNDRPSSSLEYVFLLAKRPSYYFDCDAVRKPHRWQDPEILATNAQARQGLRLAERRMAGDTSVVRTQPMIGREKGRGKNGNAESEMSASPAGRNRRNGDWWFESVGMLLHGDAGEVVGFDVPPSPQKMAHFATMPEKLVEPMVLAGTSERGCCGDCGSPWIRVVEREEVRYRPNSASHRGNAAYDALTGNRGAMGVKSTTTGWRPSCACYGTPPLPEYPDDDEPDPAVIEAIRARRIQLLNEWRALPSDPCICLDPFAGSGTTGAVANFHGRSFVGLDLSSDYLDMAARRIRAAVRPRSRLDPAPARDTLPGQMSLFED